MGRKGIECELGTCVWHQSLNFLFFQKKRKKWWFLKSGMVAWNLSTTGFEGEIYVCDFGKGFEALGSMCYLPTYHFIPWW